MSYNLSASELDDIRSSYEEELAGLTFNSKPIINMLTTIAQENMNAAGVICKTIEDRIHSAPPTQKLPVMYLLDSISKNVGSPFTPIFARSLYTTYMGCYTAVDTNTRRSLEALFSTWKLPVAGSNSPVPVYPVEDTRKIDDALLRMRAVQERNTMYQQYAQLPPSRYGPASPFPAQTYPGYPPSAVPFLEPVRFAICDESCVITVQARDRYRQSPPVQFQDQFRSPVPVRNPAIDSIITDIEGLLRTLETRVRLDPNDVPTNTFISSLRGLHEMLRTQNLRPLQLEEIRDQLRKVAVFCAQPMRPPQHPSPPTQAAPLDLFAQLAQAGILPPAGTNAIQSDSLIQPFQAPRYTGVYIELNSNAMLPSRPELIDLLYSSMPLQCYQCGQRWHDSPEQRALKDEHLDWHFRTNKRLREHSVRSQSRALFLTETEWINFSISDDGSPEQKHEVAQIGPDLNLSTVPKPSDPSLHDSICPICKETFVTDWDDQNEDWVWKNAVDVNKIVYHATCHAEALAAQKKAIDGGSLVQAGSAAEEKKEGKEEDEDEDIALPTTARPELKEEEEASVPSHDLDFVKQEADQEMVLPAEPFVLEDALKSLSGTLMALNGLKRKASQEGDDTERRIKTEPDTA